MHEFELINKYFSKLSKLNKSSLDLNDDVFFDKKKSLVISIDTYNEYSHFLDFLMVFFCISLLNTIDTQDNTYTLDNF